MSVHIKPMTKPNLSARWKREEHEVLNTKEIRFGDVSGWSRATTHFVRPDNVRMPKRVFTPCDTDKLVPVPPIPAPVATPPGICVPVHTPEPKTDVGEQIQRTWDISASINARLDNLNKRLVRSAK